GLEPDAAHVLAHLAVADDPCDLGGEVEVLPLVVQRVGRRRLEQEAIVDIAQERVVRLLPRLEAHVHHPHDREVLPALGPGAAAGFAASAASTSRANVRACARTSNSVTYSQPACRTFRMSLRVAGFAPPRAAVTLRPAPHSTISCRTSVPSLVTSRLRVR